MVGRLAILRGVAKPRIGLVWRQVSAPWAVPGPLFLSLALHTALLQKRSLTLLVSCSLRQSSELFRYVKQNYKALGRPLKTVKENDT